MHNDVDSNLATLLEALDAAPEDDALRAKAARALERGGQVDEAFHLLVDRLTNLTAHEEGPLPCLCKRCIAAQVITAEHQGSAFYREFTATSGRVLFFWVLDEIPRKPSLSRAVEARLREKLAASRRRRRRS